jgi:hypothetical protein
MFNVYEFCFFKVLPLTNIMLLLHNIYTKGCFFTIFQQFFVSQKYFSYRRSWKGSRLFCYARYSIPRGNLASVTSKEENDFIANLANTTIWIGLEGRGVYRGELPISSK